MNPIGNCERREPREKDRTDADSTIQLPPTIDLSLYPFEKIWFRFYRKLGSSLMVAIISVQICTY